MDVRCPQCQTLYELDDQQVARGTVTLKCSQCQHVFRLTSDDGVGENVRRWMIRRKKVGDIIYLTTFGTLHERILKQEVRREDEISRTGSSWVSLGDVPEFGPMFQVVDSISQMDTSSAVSSIAMQMEPAGSVELTAPGVPSARERVRTEIQFDSAPKPPKLRSMRTEDITQKVGPMGPPPPGVDTSDDEMLPPPPPPPMMETGLEEGSWTMETSGAPRAYEAPVARRGGAGGVIAVLLVLVAAGGAGYYFLGMEPKEADPKPVALGEPEGEGDSNEAPDPVALIGKARDRALTAARLENDGIWTMWHDQASRPFYVALDTAYAAADAASAVVEVEDVLRDARMALENGKTADASRKFREVLAREPRNAEAISGLGWTLLAQQETREAALHFRRAIDVDPSVGDAYIGMGTAHRQLGEPKEAYDAYDLYLGRFPKGPKASIASYQMEQLRKQIGTP